MFGEIIRRFRLIVTIIFRGDLTNGNLRHLRAMLAELEYIITHQGDMEKGEIIQLIIGDVEKANTGMLHHLRHILTSQNWAIIAAEMREVELMDARRRVMEFLAHLRSEK
jgi:hypothetical protein